MTDVFGIIAAIGIISALIVTFLQHIGYWEKTVDALHSLWEMLKEVKTTLFGG
jgi:hypothetical protein